jgi:2-polyprenyl-3-methyl-5-hydroxy-6-metoxy-1,4-benzoquinol methylase
MAQKPHDPVATNKAFWDHIAPVHHNSYASIDELRSGGTGLDDIQLRELGDVHNKSVLHLQCHIGTDSISLERQGAHVTGVDFSTRSIEIAQQLNSELNATVAYICCDIYDLANHLDEKFDVVYTTQGVLTWLADIDRWGELVAHFLKPGGFLYLMDIHPIVYIFDNDTAHSLKIKFPYFASEPFFCQDEIADYSDPKHVSDHPTFEWIWTMSDIVNSLLKNNLSLAFLNEFHKLFYRGFTTMKKDGTGWWRLPRYDKKLPLMFTLKAVKPSM